MPELPAVEFGRRLVEEVAKGRRIVRARIPADPIIYEMSPHRLRRALQGRRIDAVHRWGKIIWWELDQRPWPLFHFGMSGAFRAPGRVPLVLNSWAGKSFDTWPPPYARLHVWLDDGRELALTDPRRFARVWLRQEPTKEPPVSDLGFDPCLAPPSPEAFWRRLEGRSVTLKGVLLDQRVAAGVGNWIADEVLYQAGLDPRRRVSTLTRAEANRLLRQLIRVIRRAVEVNARKERFPRSWLYHRRWQDGGRDARGRPIRRERVAGRTTAWVPSAVRPRGRG
jgi:formamidopyrimidine-DNA glycosylase